jgi:hypothetical protein
LSQSELTERELISVAERAISFQRYLFRKTYAVYYLIWAVALTLFALLPPFFEVSFGHLQGGTYDAISNAAIITIATIFTIRNFGRLKRTNLLRKVTKGFRSRRSWYSILIVWWMSSVFIIPISFGSSLFLGYTVLYLVLATIAVFIYLNLRDAFADSIPVEGKVATLSYLLGATSSYIISIMGLNLLAAIPWLVTSLLWYSCSIHAFMHCNDELRVVQ